MGITFFFGVSEVAITVFTTPVYFKNIHLAINTELEALDSLAIELGQSLEKQSFQMAENQEELINNELAKIRHQYT